MSCLTPTLESREFEPRHTGALLIQSHTLNHKKNKIQYIIFHNMILISFFDLSNGTLSLSLSLFTVTTVRPTHTHTHTQIMFKPIEDSPTAGSNGSDVHLMSLEEVNRTVTDSQMSNNAKRTISQMFMGDQYSKDLMVSSAADGSIQTIFGGIDLSSAAQDSIPVPIHMFQVEESGQKKRKRKSSSSKKKSSKSSKKKKQVSRRQARNRISAKRSRLRKESLTSALKDANRKLEEENRIMRDYLQKLTGQTVFLRQEGLSLSEPRLTPEGLSPTNLRDAVSQSRTNLNSEGVCLVQCLESSEKSFILTDNQQPDNPITFASEHFFRLTGFSKADVIGRNCRFLQGALTNYRTVTSIRNGIAAGDDVAVTLVNYKKSCIPFWNQLLIFALRDGVGRIVNFLGIQSAVKSQKVIAKLKSSDVSSTSSSTSSVSEDSSSRILSGTASSEF